MAVAARLITSGEIHSFYQLTEALVEKTLYQQHASHHSNLKKWCGLDLGPGGLLLEPPTSSDLLLPAPLFTTIKPRVLEPMQTVENASDETEQVFNALYQQLAQYRAQVI